MTQSHARFMGSTLILEGDDQSATQPAPFQWVNAKWRCSAVHYRSVWQWLQANELQNRIPRWHNLTDYQQEALVA